jgi:hypothetical protein
LLDGLAEKESKFETMSSNFTDSIIINFFTHRILFTSSNDGINEKVSMKKPSIHQPTPELLFFG